MGDYFFLILMLLSLGPQIYILVYLSMILHEFGHALGAWIAGLTGKHLITIGIGSRALSLDGTRLRLTINSIPVFRGWHNLSPRPVVVATWQRVTWLLGGVAVHLLLATISFFVIGSSLAAEQGGQVFVFTLRHLWSSGWMMMFGYPRHFAHSLQGVQKVIYLLGAVNTFMFWGNLIPLPVFESGNDGMQVFRILLPLPTKQEV